MSLGVWVRSSALLAAIVVAPQVALANHPVLVEGELDFDGDGVVGLAEDTDGDLVFGTITRALGAAPAIGQNGTVFIVTSGRFPEVVSITNQVTLEAAPGVVASIDAFLVPADPRLNDFPAAQADPFALQNAPGIIVDSPRNRYVILRNLSVVNWTNGIEVRGDSRVLVDNVRSEHNINNGLTVLNRARVAVRNSVFAATGFRLNPMTGDFPTTADPNRGSGINFLADSSGDITNSTVSGNFDDGIRLRTRGTVNITNVQSFDNERRNELR